MKSTVLKVIFYTALSTTFVEFGIHKLIYRHYTTISTSADCYGTKKQDTTLDMHNLTSATDELHEKFNNACLSKFPHPLTFSSLPDMVTFVHATGKYDRICEIWTEAFTSIYNITSEIASIRIPDEFKLKFQKWAGQTGFENGISNQKMIKITNLVIQESTIHNVLRTKRPLQKSKTSQLEYIIKESVNTRVNCDFCNYTRHTAEDLFGRIENKHAFSAANAFQLDKLHSMAVFRKHDPINWSMEEIKDVFRIAEIWFNRAYSENRMYQYPVIYWDLLPKSGGSQFHPHIHMLLSRDEYPGAFERWDERALEYDTKYSSNYFNDLIFIHKCLGLTIQHKSSIALGSLTPKRDYELVLISPTFGDDFIELLFYCMKAFMEEFENFALSLAVRIPPMVSIPSKRNIPLYARLVSRGAASAIHSDVTSMELFTIASANVDPFDVIKRVKRFISRNTTQH